jgi:hypothetical protein
MTRLRKMMLEELQRRNYSEITTRQYLQYVTSFARSGEQFLFPFPWSFTHKRFQPISTRRTRRSYRWCFRNNFRRTEGAERYGNGVETGVSRALGVWGCPKPTLPKSAKYFMNDPTHG